MTTPATAPLESLSLAGTELLLEAWLVECRGAVAVDKEAVVDGTMGVETLLLLRAFVVVGVCAPLLLPATAAELAWLAAEAELA